MTVRVTTLKGVDADAYCVEQLPNYSLDSGEPEERSTVSSSNQPATSRLPRSLSVR